MTPVCLPNRQMITAQFADAPLQSTIAVGALILALPAIAIMWVSLGLVLFFERHEPWIKQQLRRLPLYVKRNARAFIASAGETLDLFLGVTPYPPVAGDQGPLQSAVSGLSTNTEMVNLTVYTLSDGSFHLPAPRLPQAHDATGAPPKLPLQRQARCKKFPTGTLKPGNFVQRTPRPGHRQNTTI